MMTRILTVLLICLGTLPAFGQTVLVNTRLPEFKIIDYGEELTLDLREFFQNYPEPGPVATFTFSLPVQNPNPESEDGLWQYVGATDSARIMRYELASGEAYEDPYKVTADQYVWQEHSVQYRLLADRAPVTVANFMTYVHDAAYDETIVHRSEISVVQAGGVRLYHGDESYFLEWIPTRSPIPFEQTVANTEGTLAMARQSGLNTASSQFFINLDNNRNAFGRAYSVFGELVDPGVSLPILQQMEDVPVYNLTSIFTSAPFGHVPLFAPFWDDPASYLTFDSITIPEGDPDGVTYKADFFDSNDEVSDEEAANREAFGIHIEGSELNITRTGSGSAIVEVTGTAGDQSVSFTLSVVAYDPDALDKFPSSNIDTSGWLDNAWFGWLYADDFPTITHANHGYQYVSDAGSANIHYLYDYKLDSWLYTTVSFYPYLYVYSLGKWVYYSLGTGDGFEQPRWFYVFDGENADWIQETDL